MAGAVGVVGGQTGIAGDAPGGGAIAFPSSGVSAYPVGGSASTSGSFSVELWIKPTSFPASGQTQELISTRTGSSNSFDVSLSNPIPGSSAAGVHSDLGNGSGWMNLHADAPYTFAAGQWYHIVETVSPSTYAIYVNGQLEGSGATNNPGAGGAGGSPFLSDATRTAVLGGYSDSVLNYSFVGSMSNVAFYSSALDVCTVWAHYEAGIGASDPCPAPSNTTVPGITGTAQDGQTLSASSGAWGGTSPTYAWQWQRSPDSVAWSNIAGATSSSYALQDADVGDVVRVVVTATNSFASRSASSAATGLVAGAPPANTVTPVVTGSAVQRQVLLASTGTWSGSPTLGYAYQWQSSPDGAAWANVSGATGSSYTPRAADVGDELRVVVDATNAVASVAADSVASPVVAAASAYSAVVAGSAPVDWWSLGDASSSSWANQGSDSSAVAGAVGVVGGQAGIAGDAPGGGAIAFPATGVSAYPVGGSASISGSFSVELWIKPSSLPTNGHTQELVSTRTGSDNSFDLSLSNPIPGASAAGVHSDLGNGSGWMNLHGIALAG